jgi:hypothetical protein
MSFLNSHCSTTKSQQLFQTPMLPVLRCCTFSKSDHTNHTFLCNHEDKNSSLGPSRFACFAGPDKGPSEYKSGTPADSGRNGKIDKDGAAE